MKKVGEVTRQDNNGGDDRIAEADKLGNPDLQKRK